MARTKEVPALTSGQARYILEKLIDEGRVTPADLRRHLSGMWEEMSMLEKRVAELRGLAEPVKHPIHAAKEVAKSVRKKTRKLSAKTRASYQLQGQYLGYMRQLPERDRAKYKRMAQEQGRAETVSAMRRALGK